MKLTMCEIVQQVKNGADWEQWAEVVNTKKTIKKACMILHDKDTKEDGTPKEPHIHLYLHFGTGGQDVEYIAEWFKGCRSNCVEKIKGRWNNALNYAIHKNAPSKHQYDVGECLLKNVEAQSVENVVKSRLDSRIEDYVNRTITYSQLIKLMTPTEQMKFDKEITLASKIRNERKAMEENRSMEVWYFWGPSGCGKTTIAKAICKQMDYDVYISSSSNDALGDYRGQRAIILDDIRANAFTFADLLKLTDNHTNTTAKSRYYNKSLDCEFMCLTSVIAPWELYKNTTDAEEPLRQLMRRIKVMRVDEEGNVEYIKYDANNKIIEKKPMPFNKTLAFSYLGIKETIEGTTFDTMLKKLEAQAELMIEELPF